MSYLLNNRIKKVEGLLETNRPDYGNPFDVLTDGELDAAIAYSCEGRQPPEELQQKLNRLLRQDC